MDQGLIEIKHFFAVARNRAKARLKPFVIEMEKISLDRAKNLIDDAQASIKMQACCVKNGVNPMVVNASYFEAQGIKMSGGAFKGIDFDARKRGVQRRPHILMPKVGIDFNGKKPNRQRTPKIDLPQMGFKPVNLFRKGPALVAAPRKLSGPGFEMPKVNINLPFTKNKKHKGRFEMVDLFPGPKGSREIVIKPVFKMSKSKKKKKRGGGVALPNFEIKPFDFGGFF